MTEKKQPNDLEISKACHLVNIIELAKSLGIQDDEIAPFGSAVAKIKLSFLKRMKDAPLGKYVIVTGITPTPLGEGKTTLTMGVSQSIGAHLHVPVFACIRQPSQGPTFGIKGGAAGGGYAQAVPMTAINLHLTGDIHAVVAANNLLAAAIDARIMHENTSTDQQMWDRLVPARKGKRKFSAIMYKRLHKLGIAADEVTPIDPETLTPEQRSRFVRLGIDPASVTWTRVLDTSDRALRRITVCQGEEERKAGGEHATQVDMAVSSEVMACLALTTSIADMRARMGRIVFGQDKRGEALTADDLGVGGAMTVLMLDALAPTLLQSLEHTPVFVHAGPFANIAHGNSSILADLMALRLVGPNGVVLTEAGFGADMGLVKALDIKCRYSGLCPSAVLMVSSVRALKMHGGGPSVVAGTPLPDAYLREDLGLVERGCANMLKHVENARKFGLPVVVAVNRFATDSDAELRLVQERALAGGAFACHVATHYQDGGAGAVEVSKALMRAVQPPAPPLKILYPVDAPIKAKIECIAREIFGAASVQYEPMAEEKIVRYTALGFTNFPVCMAKTQYSFSGDPALKGVPKDFVLPIRDVRAYTGAGFITCLVGSMMMMPGLPTRPAFYEIDVDENGEIVGLN